MAQLWNTSGGSKPASTDDASVYMGRCLNGIDTAITGYSGTSDPSSGAPIAWGAAEVGAPWRDTTVAANPVWKQWQQLTSSPTYGWRTLRLSKRIDLATQAALTFSPVSPAAADQTWTTLDLSTLLDSHQDAGQVDPLVTRVLLRVRIRTGASETIPLTDDAWISFRRNGSTNEARVYAQIQNRYAEDRVWVDLDGGEILEWRVEVGGGTPAFEYEAWLVSLEEAF